MALAADVAQFRTSATNATGRRAFNHQRRNQGFAWAVVVGQAQRKKQKACCLLFSPLSERRAVQASDSQADTIAERPVDPLPGVGRPAAGTSGALALRRLSPPIP